MQGTVRPAYARALVLIAWSFVALTVARHGIWRPMTIHGVDYPMQRLAARALIEGRNPYVGDGLWLEFIYPQFSTLATFWLGWFEMEMAQRIWKMLMLAAIVGAWWIARQAFSPGMSDRSGAPDVRPAISRQWALVCALVIAVFSPATSASLYVGQIEPLNAFLGMAFVASLVSERRRLAGMFWAMLCLIKVTPLALLIPLALWKEWRVLQGWLISMMLYLVLLVVTGRIGFEWFFVSKVLPEIPFAKRGISISLPSLLAKHIFSSPWFSDPALYLRIATGATAGMSATYLAVMMLIRIRGISLVTAIEIAVLFIPFLSPLLEPHHMAWTLPVVFLQLRRWMRGEIARLPTLLLAAGWSVVCMNFFFYNLGQNWTGDRQVPVFFGALLVLGVSIHLALKETTSRMSPTAASSAP